MIFTNSHRLKSVVIIHETCMQVQFNQTQFKFIGENFTSTPQININVHINKSCLSFIELIVNFIKINSEFNTYTSLLAAFFKSSAKRIHTR